MNLPQDTAMLLSVINMKLRDEGVTLEEYCRREDISETELKARLASAGYHYSSESNRFI